MQTLKFKIRSLKKDDFLILKDFCHYSNNLYNYSLYVCKKFYEETGKYIGLSLLIKEVALNENYILLPSQTAQQVVRTVDKNIRSFFALLRRKFEGKYFAPVNFPRFRKKGTMFNLVFTYQNSHIKKEDKYMFLSSSTSYNKYKNSKRGQINIKIPFNYKLDGKMKQILIKPINNGQYFNCYIYYEESAKENKEIELCKENYLSIDLGLDNLCTCVNSNTGQSFIINGKPLKSYNAYFNKTQSKIKSELKIKNKKNWSKRLESLNQQRYWFVDNYFNQVVSFITKYCKYNDIGNIIIGYNKGWKNKINLGKTNNKNFHMLPFFLFKRKLDNKCKSININFIQIEESYTSKCSALDLEKICKHEAYEGNRIKRGLYKTREGKLINADVNGSLNILRKVIGNDFIHPISDLMFNPVKYNIL